MHSALFVAAVPDADRGYQGRQEWMTYLHMLQSQVVIGQGVVRLAENVWLVNLRHDPGPLAALAFQARAQNIAYGILPFDDEPQWLPDGFDPSTIRGRSV